MTREEKWAWDDLQMMLELVKLGGVSKGLEKVIAKYKRRWRELANRIHDPLEHSMMKDWRSFCPREDGETLYEYTIYKDEGETDEEINEFIDDMEIHNYSPYDCSGKLVTSYIHWNRTPAGIVIVHCKVLDV